MQRDQAKHSPVVQVDGTLRLVKLRLIDRAAGVAAAPAEDALHEFRRLIDDVNLRIIAAL
jgi:hypothetical protein